MGQAFGTTSHNDRHYHRKEIDNKSKEEKKNLSNLFKETRKSIRKDYSMHRQEMAINLENMSQHEMGVTNNRHSAVPTSSSYVSSSAKPNRNKENRKETISYRSSSQVLISSHSYRIEITELFLIELCRLNGNESKHVEYDANQNVVSNYMNRDIDLVSSFAYLTAGLQQENKAAYDLASATQVYFKIWKLLVLSPVGLQRENEAGTGI
ncbi:hypothetical protein MSG28_004897 [Choristoneura fumiferana]|uniref:Uncharacterized protein n=1 Tax=Choristoneura fumiferana TaxID=7141 RepID=A0ACC0JP34_CHOFU|nr:hypothetical protein MSG28_004897 [Choristoneura fumiferana]